jgi:hypothetical protein
MKRVMFAALSVAAMVLVLGSMAQAAITAIDFQAVALRASNVGAVPGTITEWTNGNGVTADTPLAGQKVYYGTSYFDGKSLSDINYVEFTCRPKGSSNPYMNLVIKDGAGHYGVISSQGGQTTTVGDTVHVIYSFAANSGNAGKDFMLYEPSGEGSLWAAGKHVVWSDISDWTLLGVGETRLQSSGVGGENGVARAPLTDSLAIMWGDSAANYLGTRDIFGVSVVGTNGETYVAGTPEPATMVIWSLLGLAGVGYGLRRRKQSQQ